jgi:hypothetical protein
MVASNVSGYAAEARRSLNVRWFMQYAFKPCKLWAFSAFGGCLQAPKIGKPSENVPKVSSRNRRNFRFGETFCGDEFRSSSTHRVSGVHRKKPAIRDGLK